MSKVLVDRELLRDCSAELSDWRMSFPNADSGMTDRLVGEIDEILAQPAEAEGVSNARLMNTLAELARRAPLRTLHTICETQRQVSAVKLERYLGPIGDTLAGYAFTLRIDFDKLSAALSAVTAERDRLESMLIRTTTRHFAQQWKDRADDKKLDECLSEGIAMLEAEWDRLRAVLEGAQYPNIDRLKTLTIEQCRQVGETVMRLTIDAQSERDQLRAEVEGLRKALEQIAAGERLVERFAASGSCISSEVENDTALDYPGIAKAALAAKEA